MNLGYIKIDKDYENVTLDSDIGGLRTKRLIP